MDINEPSRIGFLNVSRFQSIKTKLLIFALLAAILPSLTLGWLSYLGSSKLLREKISHELSHATVQTSGKLDLWLKERLYDLRVFSSSYIISENLTRLSGSLRPSVEEQIVFDNVKGYLRSVCDKFGVYEELVLINMEGKPVVASDDNHSTVSLPSHWREKLDNRHLTLGKADFNPHVGQNNMLIAEPIMATDGSPMGVLVAKIDLDSLREILKRHTVGGIGEIYLIDEQKRVLVSSHRLPDSPLLSGHRRIEWFAKGADPHGTPSDYVGFRQKSVVGMAAPITSMGWGMVAEMERDHAYAEIGQLRGMTMVLVVGLMLCVGILASIFGRTLVRPLRRLSQEASRVATGDLDVDIPVHGLSEVSYLTQVFNHMVASLRASREEISAANRALRESNKELHQISITDGLTGLHNRNHIMECFDREVAQARRYHHNLSVLMIDIDHFKKINDTYGHPAGDAVMCHLAESLLMSVREGDNVGRYGGEEFLVILPQSDTRKGTEVAERIRQQVSHLRFGDGMGNLAVTISIGVSGYSGDEEDASSILSKADDALYQAKNGGRNKVVVQYADGPRKPNVVQLLPGSKPIVSRRS